MSKKLLVDEQEMYELYSILAAATTAASTGNPNGVSKHAAEAKEKLMEIHESADVINEQ